MMNSGLLMDIFWCLLVAGFIGLVIGWFIGKVKYKNEINSLNNELKLKLNKHSDRWEAKLERVVAEEREKLRRERENFNREKEELNNKIQELINQQSSKNIELDKLKKKLLIAKSEVKKVEQKFKDEFLEDTKKHKNRVSMLLNKVDVRHNKELSDLIESLVTVEGRAIKEEAELRYKLKDTEERYKNKIESLNREIEDLKKRVQNLINAKKIYINIG